MTNLRFSCRFWKKKTFDDIFTSLCTDVNCVSRARSITAEFLATRPTALANCFNDKRLRKSYHNELIWQAKKNNTFICFIDTVRQYWQVWKICAVLVIKQLANVNKSQERESTSRFLIFRHWRTVFCLKIQQMTRTYNRIKERSVSICNVCTEGIFCW